MDDRLEAAQKAIRDLRASPQLMIRAKDDLAAQKLQLASDERASKHVEGGRLLEYGDYLARKRRRADELEWIIAEAKGAHIESK